MNVREKGISRLGCVYSNFYFWKVPEVYDSLLQKYERKWDCIAKNQTTEYFIVGDKEMQEQAQR